MSCNPDLVPVADGARITNPQGGQVVSGHRHHRQPLRQTPCKWIRAPRSSSSTGQASISRTARPRSSISRTRLPLAVNRIGGGNPSQILGSLLANGRIVLINGDGIVFGPNAKINVGALLATTSDASNQDIASGKATFDKAGNPNAMIFNQGSINANSGLVGLIAPAVTQRRHRRGTAGQCDAGRRPMSSRWTSRATA